MRLFFASVSASVTDNPSLVTAVPVTIQVLDMNDNPPEIPTDEEVIVCESSKLGQVSAWDSSKRRKKKKDSTPKMCAFPPFISMLRNSRLPRPERTLKKRMQRAVY